MSGVFLAVRTYGTSATLGAIAMPIATKAAAARSVAPAPQAPHCHLKCVDGDKTARLAQWSRRCVTNASPGPCAVQTTTHRTVFLTQARLSVLRHRRLQLQQWPQQHPHIQQPCRPRIRRQLVISLRCQSVHWITAVWLLRLVRMMLFVQLWTPIGHALVLQHLHATLAYLRSTPRP